MTKTATKKRPTKLKPLTAWKCPSCQTDNDKTDVECSNRKCGDRRRDLNKLQDAVFHILDDDESLRECDQATGATLLSMIIGIFLAGDSELSQARWSEHGDVHILIADDRSFVQLWLNEESTGERPDRLADLTNKSLEDVVRSLYHIGNPSKAAKKVTKKKPAKKATKVQGIETKIASVDCSSVVPSPYQPRTTFDKAKLKQLAASIKQHGQTQACLVRPIDEGFELVGGERRWVRQR